MSETINEIADDKGLEAAETEGLAAPDQKGSSPARKRRVFLIAASCLLLLALAASALLIFGAADVHEGRIERILEFGTVANGVSLDGIQLGGMNAEQARQATGGQQETLLTATKFSVDVAGDIKTLDAKTAGLQTDYEDVLNNAVFFGRRGSFAQRADDQMAIKTGGAAFELRITGQKAEIAEALTQIESNLSIAAQDASYIFTPNGHYEDGTPFDPGKYDGKQKDFSGLVRIPQSETPNPLRYQYWKKTKYIKEHIPAHANISRFVYFEEKNGLKADTDALAELILEAVQSGDGSTIVAPTEVTEPKITLEQVKAQTQLIASWTSWYGHSGSGNRTFNVGLMSSKINGLILEPGMEWSINKDVGARTRESGFRSAGVLLDGRSTSDVGGGSCQVSSTFFNAVLRAGIDIPDHSRHTIISAYMPLGLDATISFPIPDLKIKNSKETPYFIVAYMDYKQKTVTFEVYGQPIVHETYGDVILNFSSKRTGGTGRPGTTVKIATTLPDGTKLQPGQSVSWVKARGGTFADVFIHYLDLTGNELASELHYKAEYRSFRGVTYRHPDDA